MFKFIANDKTHECATVVDLVCVMGDYGFEFRGDANRPSLRSELQGLPKFCGVAGPMWGGDHVRYETADIYARNY